MFNKPKKLNFLISFGKCTIVIYLFIFLMFPSIFIMAGACTIVSKKKSSTVFFLISKSIKLFEILPNFNYSQTVIKQQKPSKTHP